MDYREAIEIHIEECKHRIDVISEFMRSNGDSDKNKCNKNIDVLKTAISAMQELQEYHKTGLTPKQVSETVCELSATKRVLGHYKEIGTLEEVREAVEKLKAKKPKKDCVYHHPTRWCEKCNRVVMSGWEYCPDCGQRIDWSEEE